VLGTRIDFKLETLLMLLCADEPDGLNITVAAASKLIATVPTLLTCSVDGNIQPKIAALLRYAGGDKAVVGQTITGSPSLLLYSLEARLEPRLYELQELGLPANSIRVCAAKTEVAYRDWVQYKLQKLQKAKSASSDSSDSSSSSSCSSSSSSKSKSSRSSRTNSSSKSSSSSSDTNSDSSSSSDNID
jgi:hypothetical protein